VPVGHGTAVSGGLIERDEIGCLLGISASSVCQERKRLVSRMRKDEAARKRFEDLMSRCSG